MANKIKKIIIITLIFGILYGCREYFNSISQSKEYRNSETLKQITGRNFAFNYPTEMGYDILSNPICKFDGENKMSVSYTPHIYHQFLTLSGKVNINFCAEKYKENGEIKYQWDEESWDELANLKYEWHIEGKWKAHLEYYDVELEIRKEPDGGYQWNGKAFYDATTGKKEYYEGNGKFYMSSEEIKTNKMWYVHLKSEHYSFECHSIRMGYPLFAVFITPEGFYIEEGPGMGGYSEVPSSAVKLEKMII